MEQEIEEDGLAWAADFYQVDNSLGPLDAVLRYSNSELPAQRHAYIKGISAIATHVTQAAAGTVPPSSDQDLLNGVSPESTADQLVELVLELLAPGSWGEDDPDTLILVLEQLSALGTALEALSSTPAARAATSSHVQRLCQACVDTLARQGEEEEVVPACLVAYAALLVLLPTDRLQSTLMKHVEQVLQGHGEGGPHALSIALLGSVLEQISTGKATPRQGNLDQLVDLTLQLVSVITIPDEDEIAQKALLRHVGTLSLLFPPVSRGADILLPVLKTLAVNPLWSVRVAVVDALPDAFRAVGQPYLLQQEPQDAAAELQSSNRTCEALCEVLTNVLGVDVSHWVRSAAIKAAGPVICALPKTLTVPPALLALYIQSVGGLRSQPTHVLQQAASCFGCVVRQLFANEPTNLLEANVALQDTEVTSTAQQLINVYLGLMSCGEGSVIALLVEQLPELAEVFGAATTAQVLIPPVLQLPIGEQLCKARHALLPILASLIHMLPDQSGQEVVQFAVHQPEHREEGHDAAAMRDESVSRAGYWRQRLCLAEQLSPLITSCWQRGGVQLVANTLLPCISRLCQDPVWAVRHGAARQLGMVLRLAMAEQGRRASVGEVTGTRADSGYEAAASSSEMQSAAGGVQSSEQQQQPEGAAATGPSLVQMAYAAMLQLAALHSSRVSGESGASEEAIDQASSAAAVPRLSSMQLFVSACMGFMAAASEQGDERQTLDKLESAAHQLRDAICDSAHLREAIQPLFGELCAELHALVRGYVRE